jgi:hypothetical protein
MSYAARHHIALSQPTKKNEKLKKELFNFALEASRFVFLYVTFRIGKHGKYGTG